MKLEDQVVSLELAKKMKEAGCMETAEFCWAPMGFIDYPPKDSDYKLHRCFGKLSADDCYFAYSVAELGEALPANISENGLTWYLIITKYPLTPIWATGYISHDLKTWADKQDNKAVDSMAQMWLYLREKGLI